MQQVILTWELNSRARKSGRAEHRRSGPSRGTHRRIREAGSISEQPHYVFWVVRRYSAPLPTEAFCQPTVVSSLTYGGR